MAAAFLFRSRHGVFYFRRRVPPSLQSLLGRAHLNLSLQTGTLRAARVRARACAAASDELFSKASAMTRKKGADQVFRTDLVFKFGLDDDDKPYFELDAKPDEVEAAKALIASAGAAIAAVKASTATSASTSPSPALCPTMAEAAAAFVRDHQVKPSTARRYAPALAQLVEFFGASTPLITITQSRFAAYAAEVRSAEKRAPKTKNMVITLGGTFFKWCSSRYDGAPTISTETLKIKRHAPERDDRAAFSVAELRAILHTAKALGDDQSHKFWITALLVYTGMRVEELCQIDINEDLRLDSESGYWYFEIHGRGGNNVKTLAGWRQVPIHPALVTAGLLAYVTKMKELSSTKLFPQWAPRVDPKHGGMKYGHEAIKWSGHQLKKLRTSGAVNTPKATYFHSMRHTLVNNLKQALVDESVRAAIVGHELGGINNNRYGKGYGIKLLGNIMIEKLPDYLTLLGPAPGKS